MDPQAEAVLAWIAARAPAANLDADDARWLADFRCQTALLHDLGGAPEPVAAVSHRMVGALPVRLYRPRGGTLPLLLHIHGGGAIAGSVDGHDPMLRRLANRTGWLVAAPDYRLAPAHRFPAQLDDAEAALAALTDAARDLDLDAGRIVVSGDSIGGTLATALAWRLRGRGVLRGQVLLYPNTDLRRDADYPSRRSQDGHIIAADALERQIALTVASEAARADPAASPVLREDLAGLPPALVVTCGADPLRDEGEAYAARLRAAGVAVTHRRFDGMIHAFAQMAGHVDAAEGLFETIAHWLPA